MKESRADMRDFGSRWHLLTAAKVLGALLALYFIAVALVL